MSKDNKKKRRLGKLQPRYKFFLNPYKNARFTRCPECDKPTRTRKEPFFIHVDPKEPVILNMTARYCERHELLILHKDVVEDLLARVFSQHNPDIIGNDYLILGTIERSYWRQHKQGSAQLGLAFEHLHDFKQVVIYEPEHYGWVPDPKKKGTDT